MTAAILRGGRFSEKRLELGHAGRTGGYRQLRIKHFDGVQLVEGLSVELLAETR